MLINANEHNVNRSKISTAFFSDSNSPVSRFQLFPPSTYWPRHFAFNVAAGTQNRNVPFYHVSRCLLYLFFLHVPMMLIILTSVFTPPHWLSPWLESRSLRLMASERCRITSTLFERITEKHTNHFSPGPCSSSHTSSCDGWDFTLLSCWLPSQSHSCSMEQEPCATCYM